MNILDSLGGSESDSCGTLVKGVVDENREGLDMHIHFILIVILLQVTHCEQW